MVQTILDPRIPGCCASILAIPQTDPIAQRLAEIICSIEASHPAIFARVDIWRPMVLNNDANNYKDQLTETWVRIAEDVEVIVFDKMQRFYQADLGVIYTTKREVWLPDWFNLQPGDHIELPASKTYMIENIINESGVTFAQVDRMKSRFVKPSRALPTTRIMGMCARIS